MTERERQDYLQGEKNVDAPPPKKMKPEDLLMRSGGKGVWTPAPHIKEGRGGSVGRVHDSWSEGPGFNPRCGRPLPTGWVGVSIMWPAETEVMVSQLCLVCDNT